MMRFVLLAFLLPLLGCGGTDNGGDTDQSGKEPPEMPRFADENLVRGRGIWMGTCRNCHLLGISGAPAVADYTAWAPRIDKGKEALYQSALNGIQADDGKYRMPPRGGNARLEDDEVRRAVDYMLAAVKALAGR